MGTVSTVPMTRILGHLGYGYCSHANKPGWPGFRRSARLALLGPIGLLGPTRTHLGHFQLLLRWDQNCLKMTIMIPVV